MTYLHRFLTNCPKGLTVDHINRNPLDNRKSNLKVCTHKENCQNSTSNKNSTSSFVGVHKHFQNNNWVSQIKYKNKTIHLGSFNTQEEAFISRLLFLELGV